MMTAPSSRNIIATALLPVAIPPVSPTSRKGRACMITHCTRETRARFVRGVMARIMAVVTEANRRLGLRTAQRPDIAFGVEDGYLVQVASGTADGGACAVETVRYVDASRDAAVRSAVAESPAASNGITKPRDIPIRQRLATHRGRRR